MPHFVYILYSKKLGKYYIGKSAKPTQRLDSHNGAFNRNWTKRGQPWQLKMLIEFENSSTASKVEVFIKRQKSRDFIETIIENGWRGI